MHKAEQSPQAGCLDAPTLNPSRLTLPSAVSSILKIVLVIVLVLESLPKREETE
jgi:hypothetical protein